MPKYTPKREHERGLFEYLDSETPGLSRRSLLTAGLAGSAWRMLGMRVPIR